MVDVALMTIGMGIGFAMAAPVGPVNIMCLQRAVQRGFWSGVTAGSGAVAGDAVFASAAAFGITAIYSFIEGHITLLQIISGVILVIFGIYSGWRASRNTAAPMADAKTALMPVRVKDSVLNMLGAALTAFALTVTNPATMFGFFTIFSGLGQIGNGPNDYAAATTLVVSVAAGSLLWWVMISAFVSIWRGKITDRLLVGINLVSGYALAICGFVILGRLIFWS